jgi:hypothetical protein
MAMPMMAVLTIFGHTESTPSHKKGKLEIGFPQGHPPAKQFSGFASRLIPIT